MFKVETELFHSLTRPGVVKQSLTGASPRVQNGGVVTPAEVSPDRWQGLARELTGEIHRDLSRPSDVRRAGARKKLLGAEAEVFAGPSLDLREGAAPASCLGVETVEYLTGEFVRERFAGEG